MSFLCKQKNKNKTFCSQNAQAITKWVNIEDYIQLFNQNTIKKALSPHG